MLRCDGVGRVQDRIIHPNSPVPEDIRLAGSLDACLSRPVRDEWIDLIRDAICANAPVETVVVLDGAALDLACVPSMSGVSERSAWLIMLPLAEMPRASSCGPRRSLKHHEWGSLDALSRCQLDTLRHVTRGLSNQQIADVMHRSKRAVEWHIRHLHRLLGAGTRECMARLGRASGLDRFRDDEWTTILSTRPARRTLEEFALAESGDRAA
jgi:DNA-binding CsgD family transcriptional regulator